MSIKISDHEETILLGQSRIRAYRDRIAKHPKTVAHLEQKVKEAKEALLAEYMYVAECPAKIAECEHQIVLAREAIQAERVAPTVSAIVRLQTKLSAMTAKMSEAEKAELLKLLAGEASASLIKSE